MDRLRAKIARTRAPTWLLAGATVALGACERLERSAEGGIDEQTFVSVFVDLRRAAAEEATEASFARRREEILRSHGVTEDSLERFIDDNADDLDYLSDVWDRIDRTLRGELDEAGDPVGSGPPEAEDDGGES